MMFYQLPLKLFNEYVSILNFKAGLFEALL